MPASEAGGGSAPFNGTTQEIPTCWFSQDVGKPATELLSLPHASEVVVVGGGVLGVAVTYWLTRFGLNVVLLEAAQLGWGASGRNAGFMLSGSSPLEDPGMVRAVLQEEAIDAELLEPGHLALASSGEIEEKILQEIAQRSPSAPPLHWLDRAQCEDLVGLRICGRFRGGRWHPSGRTIHPIRFLYGLARAAIRRGAVVACDTRALELSCLGGGNDRLEVVTSKGSVFARHVVIACQAKTGLLIPGLQQAFTPVRGQVLCTSKLRPMFRIGLAVDWGTLYWRQVADGAIVLGGYHNLDPSAEATAEEGLNPRIQSALQAFLPDAFPGFPPFAVQQRWSGVMDETLDGKPIVGPLDGKNMWVIAGCGGHGLPPALGLARALAESVVQGKVPTCLNAFQPGRFARRLQTMNAMQPAPGKAAQPIQKEAQ